MLALMVLMGLLHAAPQAFYEDRNSGVEIQHKKALSEAQVRQAIAAAIGKEIKQVYRRAPDGSVQKVDASDLDFVELRAALRALMLKARGGECDCVVKDGSGRPVAVSVWWDDDKHFVVQRGTILTTPVANAAPPGVRFVDGDRGWDAKSMAISRKAISMLSPEELELVRDVPFVRNRKPSRYLSNKLATGPNRVLSAVYVSDKEGDRVEVYDQAIGSNDRFTGDATAPLPLAVLVVLHELAHAMALSKHRALGSTEGDLISRHDALSVELQRETDALNKRIDRYNANRTAAESEAINEQQIALRTKMADYDTLVASIESVRAASAHQATASAAARALREVMKGTPAPTSYGRTHVEEAFAECFALFRADPAALLRTAPSAHAWFAAGKHLTAN